MSKRSFSVIDYRNARYQGGTTNMIHNGIGILFDDNLMFTLAEWSNNKIDGAFFSIFPDSKFSYGHAANNHLQGFIIHHLGNKNYYYNYYRDGKSEKGILDFTSIKTIFIINHINMDNPQ